MPILDTSWNLIHLCRILCALAFQVSADSEDSIVVEVEGLESRQLRKALKNHDGIV